MPITITCVPTTKTVIAIKGRWGKRERLKIVFDDGAVLYFKVEKRDRCQTIFILDIEQTDLELVDEILLPENGNSDADSEQFDIFSVVTPEQYKQLRFVRIEFEDDERAPQVGEELFAWTGSRLEGGAGGGTIRAGHRIAEITSIKLNSKASKSQAV